MGMQRIFRHNDKLPVSKGLYSTLVDFEVLRLKPDFPLQELVRSVILYVI